MIFSKYKIAGSDNSHYRVKFTPAYSRVKMITLKYFSGFNSSLLDDANVSSTTFSEAPPSDIPLGNLASDGHPGVLIDDGAIISTLQGTNTQILSNTNGTPVWIDFDNITPERVVILAQSGGDADNLDDAITLIQSLNPTGDNRVLLSVAPGVYPVNNQGGPVDIPDFTHITAMSGLHYSSVVFEGYHAALDVFTIGNGTTLSGIGISTGNRGITNRENLTPGGGFRIYDVLFQTLLVGIEVSNDVHSIFLDRCHMNNVTKGIDLLNLTSVAYINDFQFYSSNLNPLSSGMYIGCPGSVILTSPAFNKAGNSIEVVNNSVVNITGGYSIDVINALTSAAGSKVYCTGHQIRNNASISTSTADISAYGSSTFRFSGGCLDKSKIIQGGGASLLISSFDTSVNEAFVLGSLTLTQGDLNIPDQTILPNYIESSISDNYILKTITAGNNPVWSPFQNTPIMLILSAEDQTTSSTTTDIIPGAVATDNLGGSITNTTNINLPAGRFYFMYERNIETLSGTAGLVETRLTNITQAQIVWKSAQNQLPAGNITKHVVTGFFDSNTADTYVFSIRNYTISQLEVYGVTWQSSIRIEKLIE